jgi:hypothetical protein
MRGINVRNDMKADVKLLLIILMISIIPNALYNLRGYEGKIKS